MFKKLHRQMTIFSALITSGILILMAIASLVIFERGLTRNSYERFLNNGNSCVAYLESIREAFPFPKKFILRQQIFMHVRR